jgi:hypothetical protein
MRHLRAPALVLLLTCAACSTAKPIPEVLERHVVGCVFLETVTGTSFWSGISTTQFGQERALRAAALKAQKAGATHYVIDKFIAGYRSHVSINAYFCDKGLADGTGPLGWPSNGAAD